MSFRIDPAKPFDQKWKSVAETELERAISVLEQQPNGLHEAIHEARKAFKRVRSLYRLVAPDHPEFRSRENARLRQTARSLSVVRDATALIETVDYLSKDPQSPDETAALMASRAALIRRRDAIAETQTDLDGHAKAAIAQCREAIAAIRECNLGHGPRRTARMVRKAWKSAAKRGKHALAACHAAEHSERFHDLRKAGQVYWMYLSLVRDLWPSAIEAKRRDAKRLIEMLGHEHDLCLLAELMDSEPGMLGDAQQQSHLLGAIIRRQQKLRAEALPLAEHVFSGHPRQEADVIATLWLRAATD